MREAVARPRPKTSASFEHSRGGRVIFRSTNVHLPDFPPFPTPPAGYSKNCIDEYKKRMGVWLSEYYRDLDYWKMVCEYHEARISYCEKHTDGDIPEKYRTGEDVPATYSELQEEIKKLRK